MASPIARADGITESERRLARLADHTFLRLWAYPNVFFDKKKQANGVGKELADLLVVCDDDVLIFSDKAIKWKGDEQHDLSWSRWYRSAIKESAAQVVGAERWMRQHPDRLFLDVKCQTRFPIPLPPPERLRAHGVIVASGSTDAARRHFADESGTFMISGDLKGDAHVDVGAVGYMPFVIGDVEPDSIFMHVFDPSALEIVMRELDTVRDFADYLTKRAEFIRSGRFFLAPGEEDLLAFYLQTLGPDGTHGFIPKRLPKHFGEHRLQIARGEYDAFVRSPEYERRRHADQVSYLWDRLIESFIDHVLAGTAVPVLGHEPETSQSEAGLRIMALENRVYRRVLGKGIEEALLEARVRKSDRFVRRFLPSRRSRNRRTAYVFMIMSPAAAAGSYQEYRDARANILRTICFDIFAHHAEVEHVVGIAVDAAPEVSGQQGGSQDLVAIEREAYTPAVEEMLVDMRKHLDLAPLSSLPVRSVSDTEFPCLSSPKTAKQKRLADARAADRARRAALNPRR